MSAFSLFMALLLCVSALHKALDNRRLAMSAGRLVGVPIHAGPLLLIGAGTAEVTAAVCLLVPALKFTGAMIAALLWLAYAALLLRRRGDSLDCGCDLVARERPVGLVQIVRPALLALLAIVVIFAPTSPFTLDAPFAAAGFLALWFGAAELLAIPQPAWRKY